MTFVAAAWAVIQELAPWILIGALLAGILHVILPPDFVRRRLQGRSGVLKAVLLGIPLPLCSCGVIPAGLGLRRDGASRGSSIAFLVSTPQTGVDSVLVSASFLGWPFAVFKVLSAFALGLTAGLWTDVAVPETSVEEADTRESSAPRTWRDGFTHGIEIIRTVWRWLVFGVVVSALITTLVPPGSFQSVAAYGGVFAMAGMLAVAVPLYVCATASVPIAAALVAGGFPAGAALVFLLAGPATNLATIGAVRRAFGAKTLAIYLSTITVGSIALGWTFDFLLVGPGHAHAHGAGHHEPNLFAVGASWVLLAMLAWFAIADARRWLAERRLGNQARVEVGVEGLTCNGCVRKLESELRAIPGVGPVAVSRDPGLARVDGARREDVCEAIRAAGFEPA